MLHLPFFSPRDIIPPSQYLVTSSIVGVNGMCIEWHLTTVHSPSLTSILLGSTPITNQPHFPLHSAPPITHFPFTHPVEVDKLPLVITIANTFPIRITTPHSYILALCISNLLLLLLSRLLGSLYLASVVSLNNNALASQLYRTLPPTSPVSLPLSRFKVYLCHVELIVMLVPFI